MLALAGVPMLMLPNHVEQLMVAHAVGRAGLGRGMIGKLDDKNILRVISHILTEQQYRIKAAALAKKYADFKPDALTEHIADKIMTLVPQKPKKKKPAKRR